MLEFIYYSDCYILFWCMNFLDIFCLINNLIILKNTISFQCIFLCKSVPKILVLFLLRHFVAFYGSCTNNKKAELVS